MSSNLKYGVFLARMQPLHNGHMEIINTMLQENDKVLIIIGSADKTNLRNPLHVQLRYDILKEALVEANLWDDKKIRLLMLNDLTDESDNSKAWGTYVYAYACAALESSYFTMYYSDGYEIITEWFESFLLKNFVSLKLMARGAVKDGVSATDVREMLLAGKDKELKTMVPWSTYSRREMLKAYVEMAQHIG